MNPPTSFADFVAAVPVLRRDLGPLTVLRFASAFANLRWPLRHVGKEPRSQNSHHTSLESTKHVCLTINRVFGCIPSKSFDAISKEDTVIFVKTH